MLKHNKSLNYQKAFNDVINLVKKNISIVNSLNFIVLLGSIKEKEAISNYSDLDILFVIKSNKSGVINQDILDKLKNVSFLISQKYSIEISILSHTIFDFKEYVDFNYLIHYSWGRVVFGNNNDYKKLLGEIIKEKYSETERKNLIYHNLIHARFNLIRKYISWNYKNKKNYKKQITKLVIDNLIEICDWALVYKNIFESSKNNIVNRFNQEYQINNYSDIPTKALYIRSNWNNFNFNNKDLNSFLKEAIEFIQELINQIYEMHKT